MNLRALISIFVTCSFLALTVTLNSYCHGAGKKNHQYYRPKILVVGATGTTGLRAVQGLLDAGFHPQELKLVTRNADKPSIQKLRRLGFGIVQADLENISSLRKIGRDCHGCYIHSTTSDTSDLDRLEVVRARNLLYGTILADHIPTIVYNSAAGAPDHGVARIQQKHDVEDLFEEHHDGNYKFISLRANLFMEELWKKYTRPSILAGKYPLPVNFRRKVYLTSVRDLGQLAGSLIRQNDFKTENTCTFEKVNVASDCLTGPQLAKAFARAQQSSCKYYNNRDLTRAARKKFPDLHEQIQFLQTSKETTDIKALKDEYPGILTTFDEFLAETHWGDRTRSYDNFSDPDFLEL